MATKPPTHLFVLMQNDFPLCAGISYHAVYKHRSSIAQANGWRQLDGSAYKTQQGLIVHLHIEKTPIIRCGVCGDHGCSSCD